MTNFLKNFKKLMNSLLSFIESKEDALINACRHGDKNKAELLIKQGARNLDEAFHHACLKGYLELAMLLIEKGAKNFDTGIIMTCSAGHKDLTLLLLAHGANVNNGLCVACSTGNVDMVLLLIEQGANEWTHGLIYACGEDHKDIAILMIEHGADINKCTLELTEIDIDYLFKTNKIKNFGIYRILANVCQEKTLMANQIMKELNMRDVDTVIATY